MARILEWGIHLRRVFIHELKASQAAPARGTSVVSRVSSDRRSDRRGDRSAQRAAGRAGGGAARGRRGAQRGSGAGPREWIAGGSRGPLAGLEELPAGEPRAAAVAEAR